MSRLALSDSDKQVRDWFVDTSRQLGCKVTVDAMGNIFAVRPGKLSGPPTCIGSHFDTQSAGGRYVSLMKTSNLSGNAEAIRSRMAYWGFALDSKRSKP